MKGFKYDKFKEEVASGDSWGSYSDLFMVLSFVFLMMYVVASLRSGTNSIQQRIERQKVSRENEDLRAQIKAYNTLKDQALKEETQDEQKVYEELMDKLSLLQEEAKEEKDRLRKEAIENEKKEMALNKYQQVVRNIINANMLAKKKLVVRAEIIENKNNEIDDLNEELTEKKQEIIENNKQIVRINTNLQKNIADLQKAQKLQKITKKAAYEQIARLKKKSQEQIAQLNNENKEVQQQLSSINAELQKTSQKLAVTETQKNQISEQLEDTQEKLQDTVADYTQQINQMKNAHAAKMAQEKAAFDSKLAKANLTAAQKAQQLAEFNKQAREKGEQLNRQIANLQSDLQGAKSEAEAKAQENAKLAQKLEKTVGDYEGQIKGLQSAHADKMAKERAAFEGKLAAANMGAAEKARQLAEFNKAAREKEAAYGQQIAGLQGDLKAAQERANARAKLSKDIANALKSAGVEANVNPGTGDVTISFGNDYFDSGSAELKGTMSDVLRKFVPKYSEALFKDPKIAEKITSVDIIGFASPTYQNRYVDPTSLNEEDQKAAKYNLDLSYKRARSIFDYMFDKKKISYQKQQQLLGLVKVTGRSFFGDGRAPAGATPGMSQKEFCAKFDCKQSQKVIIKFNMDDKK